MAKFADVVLGLAERNDEYLGAQADLELAISQVESIKSSLEDLAAKKKEYEENMKQSQEDYQNALAEMEAQYANMTEELRREFEANITSKFDLYNENFNSLKESYLASMDNLVVTVQSKVYGLKINSMTLRSMILSLYIDYCDGIFYHGFRECNSDVPLMSDSFEALLVKLSDLQWDVITSMDNLPGVFNIYQACH